ncbi:MAG: sulfatase-like hydrolase/transferase [Saprospiraceae bacterium]|nr:sulfatase-like hydrolase/transferase [Saprospiraceae bacterium]
MMKEVLYIGFIVLAGILCMTPLGAQVVERPNVVLIMADDMGYECLGVNGSTEYETPVLNRLASQGIRFTNFHSQPLCTPSRVKIMTGKYNYRNYEYFGYLNPAEFTFGQLMKDAGYATCAIGKWQLNGLYHGYPDAKNHKYPSQFGFDEFCLWQVTERADKGERYANPLIEQNGEFLDLSEDTYGPDIFCEYGLNFIDRHQDQPFFLYYPMVLVHDPFVPTPDSKNWGDKSMRYDDDTVHFADMVNYADKVVGRIWDHLKNKNLDENTILIFLGDNGNSRRVWSNTKNGPVRGGKGTTLNTATHVPFIFSWPQKIKQGAICQDLIGIQDVFATLTDLTGQQKLTDGISLLPLANGEDRKPRSSLLIYYNPVHSDNVNRYRNIYVQTKQYKLYRDGKFIDLIRDPLEENPIKSMSTDQLKVFQELMTEMKYLPPIP